MYGDIYHLVSYWRAEAELLSDWWRGGLTRETDVTLDWSWLLAAAAQEEQPLTGLLTDCCT